MNRFLWIFFIHLSILFSSCSVIPRNKTVPVIYSTFVKDSFEVYVDLPDGYNKDSNHYSIIYYMDASLNLGYQLRHKAAQTENDENLKNVIFVGIGHWGSYAKLRNRDFIPPIFCHEKIKQSRNPYRNHADKFYQFLTEELIPYINYEYPNNGNKTYVGHSLSGLFGIYCLFRSNPVFKNFVILSPSLWANNSNFFKYEKYFRSIHPQLNTQVYYACGTREWGNEILSTSRKLHKIVVNNSFPGIRFNYVEHPGKDHYGVVPVSLEWVLMNMPF